MTDYKNIFKNTKGVSKRLFCFLYGHFKNFGHFLVTFEFFKTTQL